MEWVPQIIRLEMARQLHFYRLANELRADQNLPPLPVHRNQDSPDVEQKVAEKVSQIIPFELHNVTDVFSENDSKMVKNILNSENNNALALGLSLPGLTGKLGSKKLDKGGALSLIHI